MTSLHPAPPGGSASAPVRVRRRLPGAAPAKIRQTCPEILLDLRANDTVVDLAGQAIDLALRTGTISNIPRHLAKLLFTFRWVTCAAPDYLARRGAPASPAALARHDLIAFRNPRTGLVDPWRYPASEPEGPALRLTTSPAVLLDDANAACAGAFAGAGLLWAPEWLVNRELCAGQLVEVLSQVPGERMRMSIIRRDQHHNPERLERVVAFLKENRSGFVG